MTASTVPFDEVDAAAKLGFPGEQFEWISPEPYNGIPDLYWVIIGSGARRVGRPVIVVDKRVVLDTGYAVGMAWLRRLAASNKPDLKTVAVPQVLRWYDSLPLGWTESDLAELDTDHRAGVSLHPLEVRLYSSTFIGGWPRQAPPPPPVGPWGPPPGEPPAWSAARSAQPSGPPGGPSGGYAPPRWSRAILREDARKLTWFVGSRDPYTHRWTDEFLERAEP